MAVVKNNLERMSKLGVSVFFHDSFGKIENNTSTQ
jgi:hypothetical protein